MSSNWFIALRVPPGAWFDRVRGEPEGVRVFHPDDLHITVAFLGPVDSEAAFAAFTLAPRWPTAPIDVSLGQVLPMGNPRQPSALAAHVEDSAAEINAAIGVVREQMCVRAGARPDARPPLAHVTVARFGRRSSRPERARALAWAKTLDLGKPCVRLSELVLYRGREDRSERLFGEHAVHELK